MHISAHILTFLFLISAFVAVRTRNIRKYQYQLFYKIYMYIYFYLYYFILFIFIYYYKKDMYECIKYFILIIFRQFMKNKVIEKNNNSFLHFLRNKILLYNLISI